MNTVYKTTKQIPKQSSKNNWRQ